MKRLMVTLVAMAFVIAMVGGVYAATQDVNVTANIVGSCHFNSKSDVAFGTLDQTSGSDATANGSLVFWCTKNAIYALSDENDTGAPDGDFSGTMTNLTAGTIAYTLTYTNYAGPGAGKTAPITSAITGTILNADYVNAEAGSYSDVVTFTIAP